MAASGSYVSALGDLRDTAKWIMAAFTGGGAIVFSGLTITNISTLAQSGQWLIPVGLALIPLAAAVFATAMSMRVINVTTPSVGLIFPRYWEKIGGPAQQQVNNTPEFADELPNAIGVYGSTSAFEDRLIEAHEDIDRARELKLADDSPERQANLDQALTVLDGLQSTVKNALDCAAYTRARGAFRAFSWWVLFSTFVALGGVIASGVVTGDLQHDKQVASAQAAPAPASFRGPTPVRVWLTSRQPPAAGGPDACPLWDGMPALAVGGTPARPVLLFPGYTAAAARSHGIRSTSSHCADPWLWTAKTGEVLVVP